MATTDQLYSLQARTNEIWNRVKAGSMTIETALAGIQAILNGDFPKYESSRLDDYLPVFTAQQMLLTEYFDKFASTLGLSNKQVKQIADKLKSIGTRYTDLPNNRTIDNCGGLFFLWLGDLHTTFKFYSLMVEDRQKQAGGANENWYGTDFAKLRMEFDKTAYQYPDEPGVYLVDGLSLVDNWDPQNGPSVDKARFNASEKSNYYLASLEALALYAVADPELYRAQDGEKLPYYDMAGIKAGDFLDYAPYSHWLADSRQVHFLYYRTGFVNCRYARPSFRGVKAL